MSPPESTKRRRGVSSCIPCYTRKQKCDRQYPCNRCSRRRRPELCAYYPPQSQGVPGAPLTAEESARDDDAASNNGDWDADETSAHPHSSPVMTTPESSDQRAASLSLSEAFGYLEQSGHTTMALMLHEDVRYGDTHVPIPSEVAEVIRAAIAKLPARAVLDFLVRYFVAQVNWIEQLIYAPWFLTEYQRWWSLNELTSVAHVEFAILILRVCCYASQFLPSPGYTIDTIKGIPLGSIRSSCDECIAALWPLCERLDVRGSLLRVKHIALAGLSSACQGRTDNFWGAVSDAVHVAQSIGLHLDTLDFNLEVNELEKEMRRRTYCNLYIWDSVLSKRLDRLPFLPDELSSTILPRMHLQPDGQVGSDAPDLFTARVLRAQLGKFWRAFGATDRSSYDGLAVEERHRSLCQNYLETIPAVFALEPDTQWDGRIPTLPKQRQLLHIAIFESMCYNLRPVLHQQAEDIGRLPGYKRTLLMTHQRLLAMATLKVLENVNELHAMMGSSHTRFPGIIVPMFEAAVPLLCLCADASFPGNVGEAAADAGKRDPLAGWNNVSQASCLQAARDVINCLEDLGEVSVMAEVGARTLNRLIDKVRGCPKASQMEESSFREAATSMYVFETRGLAGEGPSAARDDLEALISHDDLQPYPRWDDMLQMIDDGLDLEGIGSIEAMQP